MHAPLDEVSGKAVRLLWGVFEAEQRWPSRKEFLLNAIEAKLDLTSVCRSDAISLRGGGGDEARPTFEALMTLAGPRELLAPLPAVLRHAAEVFVAQALTVRDNELPGVDFQDVVGLWPNPSRASMAFDVLRSTGSGFFIGGGSRSDDPKDFYFTVSIESLRYEHVVTLDDVLKVPRYTQTTDAGRFPSGSHLEFLKRLFAASILEQRWPKALEFAIVNRDLGYVPQLVSELRPRFIRNEFQPSQRHQLALTPDALPFVDRSGSARALLMRAVHSVLSIWRTRAGQVEIPVSELASTLHFSVAELGPVVAFLELSKWCHAGHVYDDSHLNLVVVPGDPELVLRNIDVHTFDEYMNAWNREDVYSDGFLSQEAVRTASAAQEVPAVPDLPVAFIKFDTYKRVLDADHRELRLTVRAGAWKSSLILIGSIIEGSLLDVLSRREDVAASVMPKNDLSRASLMDLIEASVKLHLVQPSIAPFVQTAKHYRDLTHPFRSGASLLRPAEESVRAMLHALELIMTDLDAAARDGRISAFELS